MKRMILLAAVLLLLGTTSYAAFTYPVSGWNYNSTRLLERNGQLANWANEVEDYLDGTTGLAKLYLTPNDTAHATTEGFVYYDLSEHALKYRTNSAWVVAGTGTFTGGNITSDVTLNADGVDIQGTTTTAHTFALKGYDVDNTTYRDVVRWTNGDTLALVLGAPLVSFALDSTGLDVTTAGAVSGVTTLGMGGALTGVTTMAASGAISGTTGTFSSGIVLDSAGTITNSSDSEFKFTDAGEDLSLDMTYGTNIAGLKTSTGLTQFDFGDVDDVNGVGNIAFDSAAANVTLATNAAADDLTIQVTGATDSSIKLASSGTGADAISLITSAGGMDLTVAGAAANEDLDITANSSVNISSTEAAVADAIVISAAGAGSGIDITSLADIDITTTGADGEDISLINTGGSVLIRGNENAADVIQIDTSGGGGTTEAIVVLNDQGTAEDSVNIDSTAGGIDIDYATGKNFSITGGQMSYLSNENVASAFAVTTNTGAAETIVLTNSQGTDAGAIDLVATTGGITLTVAASKTVTVEGSLTLENGQVIETANNNRIEFTENSDSLGLIFGSNIIELAACGDGVTSIDFNDIDQLVDVEYLIGDNGNKLDFSVNERFEFGDTEKFGFALGTGNTVEFVTDSGITTIDFNDVDQLIDVESITGEGTGTIVGFIKTVTDDTDAHTVLVTESRGVLTNAGSGGSAAHTLPAAAAGLEYTFVVMAAQQLQIDPQADDKIIYNATALDVGEYLWADAVGENLHLLAVDGTNWIVISAVGTWTQETP